MPPTSSGGVGMAVARVRWVLTGGVAYACREPISIGDFLTGCRAAL